jgi:hypothetical protein
LRRTVDPMPAFMMARNTDLRGGTTVSHSAASAATCFASGSDPAEPYFATFCPGQSG